MSNNNEIIKIKSSSIFAGKGIKIIRTTTYEYFYEVTKKAFDRMIEKGYGPRIEITD